MDQQESSTLQYRRQYIIAPCAIDSSFFQHKEFSLFSNYVLYTHVDLLVTEVQIDNRRLILLGDIYDYENPQKFNVDILNDLIKYDFISFLQKLSDYAGRYVILYLDNGNIHIAHDATALRKVYYHIKNSQCWCCSQPFLLASILKLEKTKDKGKMTYYQSQTFHLLNNSNIGDLTLFDDIHQLIPNHYLSITQLKVDRYWPLKSIEPKPIDEVAEIIGKMLKGYLKSMANRYKLMIPVTAGKDSRTLLAASKELCNDTYYYINKESVHHDDSLDIKIPKKLFKSLGLQFHVLDTNIAVDEDFKEIYFNNDETGSNKYLPIIFNYYKNFSDFVNIPGVFVAGGYEIYGSDDKNLTGEKLSKINWMPDNIFAYQLYDKWLNDRKLIFETYHINKLVLFYWEERIANWGTQTQQYKDIAQEECTPFNSRLLIEYCLSLDPKYLKKPNFILYKRIMKNLWPEVLKVPINPDLKHTLFNVLQFFGLMEPIRRMKHWFTR